MILVTVGTHELPFDRLVRAARTLPAPVVVQRGTSTVSVPGAEVHDLLPPSMLERLIGEARVVVTHGGPGSIRAVLAAGKVPIVVPRRRAHGEHVDNHQVAFGRRMARRVHLVEDPVSLAEAVIRHDRVARALEPPSVADHTAAFCAGLSRLVDDLFDR